jgi:hypothetical protein
MLASFFKTCYIHVSLVNVHSEVGATFCLSLEMAFMNQTIEAEYYKIMNSYLFTITCAMCWNKYCILSKIYVILPSMHNLFSLFTYLPWHTNKWAITSEMQIPIC